MIFSSETKYKPKNKKASGASQIADSVNFGSLRIGEKEVQAIEYAPKRRLEFIIK